MKVFRWVISVFCGVVAVAMFAVGNVGSGVVIFLFAVITNPVIAWRSTSSSPHSFDQISRDNDILAPTNDIYVLTYKDADGNKTIRDIRINYESDRYIHAIDIEVNEERTFRHDRVISLKPKGGLTPSPNIPGPKPNQKIKKNNFGWNRTKPLKHVAREAHHIGEICFTGFSANDKKNLTKQAEKANFLVRTTITKDLGFLCCGPTPGPEKMRMAESRNITILTAEQFDELTTTGLLPE